MTSADENDLFPNWPKFFSSGQGIACDLLREAVGARLRLHYDPVAHESLPDALCRLMLRLG